MIRITIAKPGDRDLLLCMQRVCLPADDSADPRRGEWLVGRTPKGTPVCFSGGYTYRSSGEAAFIVSRQGVIPSHRGLRLQKRLLQLTCRRAAELGLPEVWSYTSLANVASANSFIAAGFRLWVPAHWHDHDDAADSAPHPTATAAPTQFLYWRKQALK
ncbi:MAG: hypothetical protein IPH07_24495 [Deltaproteobacteria bacterium]|nr:hypothetical protein [Deltaproteobacteria bacterium]